MSALAGSFLHSPNERADELCALAQLTLDFEQPVVFRDALAAAQ